MISGRPSHPHHRDTRQLTSPYIDDVLSRSAALRTEFAELRAKLAATREGGSEVRLEFQKKIESVTRLLTQILETQIFNKRLSQVEKQPARRLVLVRTPHRESELLGRDSEETAKGWRIALLEALDTALPFFSPDTREALANSMRMDAVARGERIVDDEDLTARLYLMVSGVGKLGFTGNHGAQTLIAMVSAGDFIGSMALTPAPESAGHESIRSHFCDAISDCVAASLEPAELARIAASVTPSLYATTISHIVGKWLRVMLWRYGLMESPVSERLLANLRSLAADFGVHDDRGLTIGIRVTEWDLAALIGASRPKVSLAISEMERDGLVIRDRRRLILTHRAGNASPSPCSAKSSLRTVT